MPADADLLALRSRVMQAARAFFIARDYLEVQTPVRLIAPAMEEHIDVIPSGDHFLRTSPELHMKRLLARGVSRCFQLGPCFREGEQGDRHHPEFTMLEWYRAGADYHAMREETEALLRHIADALGESPWWAAPWTVVEVAEQFRRHAGWDPVQAFEAERFDLDLVERVEPQLPVDVPVALTDYPAALAAMARVAPDRPEVAERWELYLGGLEIANAYSELTDAEEQRRRFEQWRVAREQAGKAVYSLDEAFLAALSDMPEAGGVALGLDRLLMVIAGVDSLDAALPFRE